MAAGRILIVANVLAILFLYVIIENHLFNSKSLQERITTRISKYTAFRQLADDSLPKFHMKKVKRSRLNQSCRSKNGTLQISMALANKAGMAVILVCLSGDVELNPGPSINQGNADLPYQFELPAKGIRIGQWNVNYLTDTKLEQIKLLLPSSSNNIDILFLFETFLKPTKPDCLFEIQGYSIHRKDRMGSKNGGGIIAFVSNNIKAKRESDLEDEHVESMWFTVFPHKSSRPILVGALYRPPSTNVEMDLKIENNVETAYLRNQETIVMGDFNINGIDKTLFEKHRLIRSLKSLNMTQMVSDITRPVSKTCLDHVYTTHPDRITNIFIPNIGLADHLPVFICRKYNKKNKNRTHDEIKYRDFKNLNNNALMDDLENAPWDTAFIFDDCDDILSALECLLNTIFDKHIPFKQKRVKKPIQPAWMNDQIIKLINTRDKQLKRARKTDQRSDWTTFSHTKCTVTNLIKKAKRTFFKESIENNKKNPKGIWKALKSLSGTQKQTTTIKELKSNNEYIKDKCLISEELNRFFADVVSSINQDLQPLEFDDTKLKKFVESKLPPDRSYSIPVMTPNQVLEIINNIPVNKATGPDGISVRLLKLAAPAIAIPLCKLLNFSITTETFPSKWKLARVIPIYKSGLRDDRNNYRPISILPVFSKILEKHVASSFLHFLRHNNLIYYLQSAFRPGHSTETALIKLVDNILWNMDDDNVTGLVFVDFKKAFDVINHEILLKKLELYGVSKTSLSWFNSYLSNRKQFVKMDGYCSSQIHIKQGVPQGSILGPVLFLLFVNDLPLHIDDTTTMDIYADDTTLSTTSKWDNVPSIKENLNSNLAKLEQWSTENRMFINAKKTKSMLIVSTRLRKRFLPLSNSLDVILNGTAIEKVETFKLLGIELDHCLNFNQQVENLSRKLAKRIGLLRHISPYLSSKQRAFYYNAVIKPMFDYGSSIWSSCSKENELRIFKLQKRAARIILGVPPRTSSVKLFNSLGWIPFKDEALINRCAIVLKRLNGNTPKYLDILLKRNSDVHDRNTRFSNVNLVCPLFKKSTEGGRTFTVRTIRDWNNLDVKFKQIHSFMLFKRKLSEHFLEYQKTFLRFK